MEENPKPQLIKQELKLKTLWRRCVIFMSFYGVVIIIAIILIDTSDSIKSNTQEEKKRLEVEVLSLKAQVSELNEKIESAKDATKLWETLRQKDRKHDGLKIDEVKALIDLIQKFYHLPQHININLSEPKALSDIYKTQTTIVMSSNIDLKFSASSDEIIFGVIESIIKNFPGFLKINSMSIEKIGEIDQSALSQVENGTLPSLVNGALSFQWRDFKDISQ